MATSTASTTLSLTASSRTSLTSGSYLPASSDILSPTTGLIETQQELPNIIVYVAGSLSVLVLLLVVLVIVLSILYLCKSWKRKSTSKPYTVIFYDF